MVFDSERERLLFKAHQALGCHLFVLGVFLIIVLLVALALQVAGVVFAIQQHRSWWFVGGVVLVPWAGLASALIAIARILGPEGITGIVRERNNSPAIRLIGSNHAESASPDAHDGSPPATAT
jgi:hypothetical protein